MASINRVLLMGNLTNDPQLSHTASGVPVSDLGLATSETVKNKDGELVESACYTDVVVWGRQAETCVQYLSKGSLVFVEGRLQSDQRETEGGQRYNRLQIRADRVQFLSKPGKSKGRSGQTASKTANEANASQEKAEPGATGKSDSPDSLLKESAAR